MPCTPVKLAGGQTAIICTGRRPRRKCSVCKERLAQRECDYPDQQRKSGTCDKPLCTRCAVSGGDNIDFCPSHPKDQPGQQLGLKL
jgi:hypothetical protein